MSGRPGDWELSWSSDHHRRPPTGTCLWLAALSWYVLLARRSQLVRFVSLSDGTFRVPLSWYMPVACCSQLVRSAGASLSAGTFRVALRWYEMLDAKKWFLASSESSGSPNSTNVRCLNVRGRDGWDWGGTKCDVKIDFPPRSGGGN